MFTNRRQLTTQNAQAYADVNFLQKTQFSEVIKAKMFTLQRLIDKAAAYLLGSESAQPLSFSSLLDACDDLWWGRPVTWWRRRHSGARVSMGRNGPAGVLVRWSATGKRGQVRLPWLIQTPATALRTKKYLQPKSIRTCLAGYTQRRQQEQKSRKVKTTYRRRGLVSAHNFKHLCGVLKASVHIKFCRSPSHKLCSCQSCIPSTDHSVSRHNKQHQCACICCDS